MNTVKYTKDRQKIGESVCPSVRVRLSVCPSSITVSITNLPPSLPPTCSYINNTGGSRIKTGTWRVIFELTTVTEGVQHFATGSVNWSHAYPKADICSSAARALNIGQSQGLSCEHILKVSVDLGSKDEVAAALETPSSIKWAKARVVDGVKGYKGMLDVEYHDGKPYVWGGCDKDKQCVGSGDQCWQLFLLSDTAPLPPFFCAACTEEKGMVVA